jgi:hypothetical protein
VIEVTRLQSWSGTVPISRELPDKFNHVNAVKEPSSIGTVPVKVLEERLSAFKAVKEPSSDGTVPLMELIWRFNMFNAVKEPSSDGSVL